MIKDFNVYQTLAVRTANKNLTLKEALGNYALGLTGEAGEVADMVKKYLFHGHALDKIELEKELGDVLWYIANLSKLLGLDLSRVATVNYEKLSARYPDGFSEEASVNRIDK